MEGPSPTPRLLVGLGNPGSRYADTRHNVGFMLLDRIAAGRGLRFDSEKRWRADIAKDGDRYLLKPQTYMNDSGVAVGRVAAFYKIEPAEVLVIYDDMDLPLGRLRLRPGGSAGGHNGVRSIIAHLGTDAFPRLRIGIGKRGGGGAQTGHVLGKFREEERSELENSLKNALLATAQIATEGLSAAMNRFNQTPKAPKPKRPKAKPDPAPDHPEATPGGAQTPPQADQPTSDSLPANE